MKLSPVLQTLSEEEFRKDKDAVKALFNFLTSDYGQKFCAVMRGGDPMTLLASAENRKARNVRDTAIAETPNPHGLLAVCKGYRISLQFMDDLCEELPTGPAKQTTGHRERVDKAMREGPEG